MSKSDKLQTKISKLSKTQESKNSKTIENLSIEDIRKESPNSKEKRTTELSFKKLQLKEQILLRPDTYIGSVKRVKSDDSIWVLSKSKKKIIQKQVTFTEGFIRLFIEVVSNSIDNVWRSQEFGIPCKFIKINISREDNTFKVMNDGKTIPIEKHKVEDVYIPELIFGNFLTSSNYDDNEERKTSGRNGIGGTCANLFSKVFEIECFHPDVGIYKQKWNNNMNLKSSHEIDKVKVRFPKTIDTGKNGYTSVSWVPDLHRFDMSEIDDDTISVLEKYIVDVAMLVSRYGVKVYYNDEEIEMRGYKDYIKYYFEEFPEEYIIVSEPDNTCIVCPFYEYAQISFVNGIPTKDGGVHVDAWCEQLFRPLLNKLNEKDKKFDMRDIKKHFFIFVDCNLDKPRFDNQNKTKLNSPSPKIEVKPSVITKLYKWSFVSKMKEVLKSKDLQQLKGETERKRSTLRVEGLDDANFAGKSGKSQDCILCVTEGLSAKTYVVKGMKYGLFNKKGHDCIGVLPIRGKFVNVRNASLNTIIKNKEIKSIIQAIGLQHGTDYSKEENRKKLRYGKFISISDADSVSGDTPLLLKKNNLIELKTINSIDEDVWITDLSSGKEYNKSSYEVWTDKGWTSIKHVMRHKVDKKMFRVLTHTGLIDVTEDHSLLDTCKNKISPKDIKIGEKLLHHYPNFENINFKPNKNIEEYKMYELKKIAYSFGLQKIAKLTKKELINIIKPYFDIEYFNADKDFGISDLEAWVMGFFWADGSCGIYNWKYIKKPINRPNIYEFNRTSISWAISNTNLQLLEKSKEIMEKIYPEYNWTIIENRTAEKKGHCKSYKLNLNGGKKVEDFVNKYRNLFYDNDKNKKIPIEILNSNLQVRTQFFEGYLYGDGNKDNKTELKKTEIKFDVNGKIGASGLFLLARSIGYKVSINTRESKPCVISMNITKGNQQFDASTIKKIIPLEYKEQYVYDLETENHHFQAGVGQLIVHNTDGIHITGLLYNFFDVLFPTLVRNTDFFYFMRIPIVKISGREKQSFYFYKDAQAYIQDKNIKKDNIRYFKGLGTSNDVDVKEDFGKKMVHVTSDEKSQELLSKIFSKDESDYRKEWLSKFDVSKNNPNIENVLDIGDFINEELINFSIDDCKRSLPSVMDGLKESHRKVLYSAFKKHLSYSSKSLKVAQFAGYVSEQTNYHHGEQNLYETITKMAQRFVGSNNIPLLFEDGAFGSRIEMGKDAANGRYIFTKLDLLTRLLFREEDDDYLENNIDDGDVVEKKYYIPIVPIILVNGCNTGIGTGWSCNVPPYNITDIIGWIKNWMKKKSEKIPKLKPWFRGFKGSVELEGKKVITKGIFKREKNNIVITELPIGRKNISISKFKESLEELKETGYIKSIKDNSTENEVYFTVCLSEDEDDDDKLVDKLGLVDVMYTNNMVLFDKDGNIKRYDSLEEILEEFCESRYELYIYRKQGILKKMKMELKVLTNKARFVKEVTSGDLIIKDKTDDDLETELENREYMYKDGKYEYLLSIQMRHITKTKIDELEININKLKEQISVYEKRSELSIWNDELDELQCKYKTLF